MTSYNAYPETRLRRLRGTDPLRSLARETRLSTEEFIYPMFVTHGHGVREPIEPMPGCHQVSLDVMSEEVGEAAEAGHRRRVAVRPARREGPTGHRGL